MDSSSLSFSLGCSEICNILYLKDYDKLKVNTLVDELNAKPFNADIFVSKHDASILVTALCLNIKPSDEFLAAKASHLINSVLTKQDLQFTDNYLEKVIFWHIQCLKMCSNIILPDILHNMQCIVQLNPSAGQKFIKELLGPQGILTSFIDNYKRDVICNQTHQQMCLLSLKCTYLLITEEQGNDNLQKIKEHISCTVINLLMTEFNKGQDESLYCKIVIVALRVLSQIYLNAHIKIPLPEVMGLCRYFVLVGLVCQATKPDKIMPSQQTIAVAPANLKNTKNGKKQKLRKQRNNAIETLKKEIPVSDHSLMRDVNSFENNIAYKQASSCYLEPQTPARATWALTSDSDVSDIENGCEAKLIALRSRVRQSASNLLLVLIKVTETPDIFGFWWALLPDSPDAANWSSDEAAKRTLAYCAVTDNISTCRANALSVILALLAGSRGYLSQAETSKKATSFTPFSVSLGYIITCMHEVLVSILDTERSHAVIIVALKCCAALIQATPYHKMREGLIIKLVKSTRKFLVHRDKTLQVGALIAMGCVLSVDPKVDEILMAIEKDHVPCKLTNVLEKSNPEEVDCDDFEEGYSDDEMFAADDQKFNNDTNEGSVRYFKSWILDICFKNIGFVLKENKVERCLPGMIPVILESLQVLSAMAFHHLPELLLPHLKLLADVLFEMLLHEHRDVVLHTAKTISTIADGLLKLEQTDQPPPVNQCVYLWEKLLPPLFKVLQSEDNTAAKVTVCDCLANIGTKSFEELSRRVQLMWCAVLVGSCGAAEPAVRAAAVRALAVAVVLRPLREDICFVSDCGENILRALSESTLVVQIKASWALANLSDALVLNMEDNEIDDIDNDLLVRLLEVSIQCAGHNDKIKMSATRALGNLLRLMQDEKLLREPGIRILCESAVDKLMDCACKVTNMKVRWNACYAIGNALRNDKLFTSFPGWQRKVFPSLCTLCQDCKYLKVRINAAVALRAPSERDQYAELFAPVWHGIMKAMDSVANIDDYTEYQHKDNLVEQLCVTLSHMCCLLKPSDLSEILDPLVFHYDIAKALFTQLCHKLPPENASCLVILRAAKYVTVDLIACNETQSHAMAILQDIFIWDM